jgi:hypothetical protein
MSKILELREKRAKTWEAAKAFLDASEAAMVFSLCRIPPLRKMEPTSFLLARKSTAWNASLRWTQSCPDHQLPHHKCTHRIYR